MDRLFARVYYIPDEDGWLCEMYDRKGEQVLLEFGGRTGNGAQDTDIVARNVGTFVAGLFTVVADDDDARRRLAAAFTSVEQPRFGFRFDGEQVQRIE